MVVEILTNAGSKSKYTRRLESGGGGQLIPLHLNASRGNGQIYHANCHCGRDNMLNAAQAVSISLFRHAREASHWKFRFLFFSLFFFFSFFYSSTRLPSWHGHACRILIEGDANCYRLNRVHVSHAKTNMVVVPSHFRSFFSISSKSSSRTSQVTILKFIYICLYCGNLFIFV